MAEKNTKNLILISIIIAGLIIAGALIYSNKGSLTDIGSQKAGEKTISYINENLLAPGAVASLVDISDQGSIYKVSLRIQEGGEVLAEFDSYVSKDGKFLFPEGIDMDELLVQDFGAEEPGEMEVLSDFVQCLASADFVIYGNKTCPACADLAAQFGGYDVIDPIFVECEKEPELCEEKEIEFVPTIFIGGEKYDGPMSFDGFIQETGCSL